MFKSAQIGHRLDKTAFAAELPALRDGLLDAQYELLKQGKFPVVILIWGMAGGGKGETVNALLEWMDPHHIFTHAFSDPTDEERERPPMWRFWRVLPPKGKIGILFGSWYTDPILRRVRGTSKPSELDQSIDEIIRFEKMLCDEGALVVKFWFNLTREQQKARFKQLEKNPKTHWKVTKKDWENYKAYDKYHQVAEYILEKTSTGLAPWIVVEGMDKHYRNLTVGKTLLSALRTRLDREAPEKLNEPSFLLPSVDNRLILGTLDLNLAMKKKVFADELAFWQGKLNLLSRDPKFNGIRVMVVFEGPDAGGKGGAIRRITSALDARSYQIIPVAAPTEEERAQPYMWRFWRHVPRLGRFSVFDRSWYGRVLVERVEELCGEADWMRAYSEINDFERQLARNRTVMVKFWLQISKEEQLARFKVREEISFKRFKLTGEDWRNREKWDAYQMAASDMIDRTSTESAPWTLVEANDKYFARIKVLKTLCRSIEEALTRD